MPEDPAAPGRPDDLEGIVRAPSRGLLGEFWGFFRENKKWFLLPIIVVLLLVAVLLVLASTAAAPFIYTLF